MDSYSIREGGVHIGAWTDHSHGRWILTLPVKDAGYVVSATAVFITISGASLWMIVQFFVHHNLAGKRRIDGLGLHHRVLYRNGGSELSTIWDIGKIWHAWKGAKPKPERLYVRTLCLMSSAFLNFAMFTVFAVFAPKIAGTGYESNNVLLQPRNCGIITPNLKLNNTGDWQVSRFLIQTALNATQAARQYAHACYGSPSGLSQCSMFPSRSLTYVAETVDCPFGRTPAGNNICQPNAGKALRMATASLNTGNIFGVNVLSKNQIEVKKSLTCAPIQVSEYIRTDDAGLDNATTYLELGQVLGVSSYTLSHKPRSKDDNVGYQLFSLTSLDGFAWAPVDALKVSHGDISITVMAGNSIKYLEKVQDPWFSANQYDNYTQAYTSDNDLSVLACIDQYQMCNPVAGESSKCTILGSASEVYQAHFDIGLNKYQTVLANRMLNALGATSIWQAIDAEGAGAMLASRNVVLTTSNGLPDDQWELEVRDWFETSLATMQATVVQYVNNPDPAVFGAHASIVKLGPVAAVSEDYLCTSQRVRNTGGYISFSLGWLVAICCLGIVVIPTGFAIEPLWRLCTDSGRERQVVRTADSTFQILRKMLSFKQQQGSDAEWTRQLKDIPVTGGKTMFLLPKLLFPDDVGDGPKDFLPTRTETREMMPQHVAKARSSVDSESSGADVGRDEINAPGSTEWLPPIMPGEQLEARSLMEELASEHEHEHEHGHERERERSRGDGVGNTQLSRTTSSSISVLSGR